MPTGYPQTVAEKAAKQVIENKKEYEDLLPPDLSGAIFLNAKKEAAAIRARLGEIEAELARVGASIRQIRRDVLAASEPVWRAGRRRRGDIFGGFTVEEPAPDPNLRIKTESAVKLQAGLGPLETYRRKLLSEAQYRQSQLSDLRRIAELSADSAPALITWLASKWAGVFAVGAGLVGKLPKPAKLSMTLFETDRAGNQLPPEAQQ